MATAAIEVVAPASETRPCGMYLPNTVYQECGQPASRGFIGFRSKKIIPICEVCEKRVTRPGDEKFFRPIVELVA